ncbi:MAG: hypothetical protein U9Q30_01475 [Campylobacterota bacterium]|nr:hypothetical protein [Campylobacterota bacterium]
MIDKLYKLKQQQINQQVLLKQQALSKIDDIDKELIKTQHELNTRGLDVMGAISDFVLLQIHKETMKEHIQKLSQNKIELKSKIDGYNTIIVTLNKESEQFSYMLEDIRKEKLKEIEKQEEIVASEYMQAKYMKMKKENNVI